MEANGQAVSEKLHTPITGIINNISLPTSHDDGSIATDTTYIPSSIICHEGGESANCGHYVTYYKRGNDWFLINDDHVTQVNLEAPVDNNPSMSHQKFLEQNAYIISYRKLLRHNQSFGQGHL